MGIDGAAGTGGQERDGGAACIPDTTVPPRERQRPARGERGTAGLGPLNCSLLHREPRLQSLPRCN